MTRRLVIAGSGEHARVVADAAVAAGWVPIGCVGPEPAAGEAHPGAVADAADLLPWLGTDGALAVELAAQPEADRPALVLGFGGPIAARRAVVSRLAGVATWATIVHPAAWVSPSARLGAGAVVLARAVVNTGAVVGAHAIVNSGAVVEHDVRVGEHAHVAPGAVIGGGAVIGDDAFVGLNASVRDHITIGAGAIVGMGAAAVADVAPGTVATGVPARG